MTVRLTYNDNHFTLRELLGKDSFLAMHYRNLHSLVIELHKIKNDIVPQIMQKILELKVPTYSL